MLIESQNVTSTRYQNYQQQFKSQQNNRPELASTMVSDIITDATQSRENLKFLMNKNTIREYITTLEADCSTTIVSNGPSLSDEDFCNKLFLDYANEIPSHGILFDSHKLILEKTYNAEY